MDLVHDKLRNEFPGFVCAFYFCLWTILIVYWQKFPNYRDKDVAIAKGAALWDAIACRVLKFGASGASITSMKTEASRAQVPSSPTAPQSHSLQT